MRSKPDCSLWKQRQRGAAVIELALLAPVLIGLAVGIADFGRVMYASILVNNAARAAAQSALYANAAGMQAAAVQDACGTGTGCSRLPGFTTSNVTVAISCPCPGDANPGTGTQTCSPLPACATGSPMVYVNVQTTYTFTTLSKYPGFPHSVPLTGNAILRVQ